MTTWLDTSFDMQSELDLLEAGHFTWEDDADEYAALVTSWWREGYDGLPASVRDRN